MNNQHVRTSDILPHGIRKVGSVWEVTRSCFEKRGKGRGEETKKEEKKVYPLLLRKTVVAVVVVVVMVVGRIANE